MEINDLIEDYKYLNIKELAYKYHIGEKKIKNILLENNIKIKSRGGQVKYYVNHNYFDLLDIKKCRILGLLASDGYLQLSRESTYLVWFVSKDLELCEFIKNEIGGILYDCDNCYRNCINSKIIFNYLENIGITQNKSINLNFNFSIFNNNKEFLDAFLIGIIEGDGYVVCNKVYNYNYYNCHIGITTGSKIFKDQILLIYPDFSNVQCAVNIDNETQNVIYQIRTPNHNSHHNITQNIINIYHLCGMMKRKYDKILLINNYIESKNVV